MSLFGKAKKAVEQANVSTVPGEKVARGVWQERFRVGQKINFGGVAATIRKVTPKDIIVRPDMP